MYGDIACSTLNKQIALTDRSASLFPVSPFRRKTIHRRARSA